MQFVIELLQSCSLLLVIIWLIGSVILNNCLIFICLFIFGYTWHLHYHCLIYIIWLHMSWHFNIWGFRVLDVNTIDFPIRLLNPSFVVRVKIWLWIFQSLILGGSDKIHLWSLNFNQLTGTITPAYMKVLKDGSDFYRDFWKRQKLIRRDKNSGFGWNPSLQSITYQKFNFKLR
jgi:hypothetical protein